MTHTSAGRRRFCLALPSLALAPALAHAAETLRVLAWPGYADADIVQAFEQRTGVRVEVTFIDSDEALWQKISANAGADFDLFAVNTAELQRYVRARLVVPIPAASIPNLARQLPRFRELQGISGVMHGSQRFAVPYTYAEMGLIYDQSRFSRAPDSIAALWDERLRGQVIAYNGATHNFTLAAQVLGLPDVFNLGDKDWPAAVDRLVALRRNVAGFYTQPEESVALWKRRGAALMFANYGNQQLQALRTAGVNAAYSIPKEGALAWLDCWAITRGARNPALCAAWIDYLLEARPSEVLVTRQGLANTIAASPNYQPGAHLLWLEPVESDDRRARLWSRIVSGDRAARVLAA